jgi:hypothetical protein
MKRRNGLSIVVYEEKKYNYYEDTISSYSKKRAKYVNEGAVLAKMLLDLFKEKDYIQKAMQQ